MVFPAIAAAFVSFTPEMMACLNAARGVSVVYPVVSSLVGRYLGHRGGKHEREEDETHRRRLRRQNKKQQLEREYLERYLERRQNRDTNKQGGGDKTLHHRVLLLQGDDKVRLKRETLLIYSSMLYIYIPFVVYFLYNIVNITINV